MGKQKTYTDPFEKLNQIIDARLSKQRESQKPEQVREEPVAAKSHRNFWDQIPYAPDETTEKFTEVPQGKIIKEEVLSPVKPETDQKWIYDVTDPGYQEPIGRQKEPGTIADVLRDTVPKSQDTLGRLRQGLIEPGDLPELKEPRPPFEPSQRIKQRQLGLRELESNAIKLSEKFNSIDQTNEKEVNDYNKSVLEFNNKLEAHKKENPEFWFAVENPDIAAYSAKELEGLDLSRLKSPDLVEFDPNRVKTPKGYVRVGDGKPISNEQRAYNNAVLVQAMHQGKPVTQVEKDMKITGTPLGRIGASIVQGAAIIPQGIAGMMEYAGDRLGIDAIKEYAKQEGDNISSWIQEVAPDNPNFVEQLGSGLGSMLVFMPFGIGAMSLSRALATVSPRIAAWYGASASTVLEAMTEAGIVYQESQDPEAAEITFLANLGVIGLTNRYGIFSEKYKTALQKAFFSAGLEGVQEFSQEIIQDASQGKQPDYGNALTAMIIGAILGAGASTTIPIERAKLQEKLRDVVEEGLHNGTLDLESIDQIVRAEMSPKRELQILDQEKKQIDLDSRLPQTQIGIKEAGLPSDVEQVLTADQKSLLENEELQTINEKGEIVPLKPATVENALSRIENEKKRIEEEKKKAEVDKQKEIEAKKEAKKIDRENADVFTELNRQFQHAKRKNKLFDEREIAEANKLPKDEKWTERFEKLYTEALEHNKNLNEKNKLTLENVAKKKYGKSDLNLLSEKQQKDVLFDFNEAKKQGKTTIEDIETVKPAIPKPKLEADSKIEPSELEASSNFQKEGEDKGIIPPKSPEIPPVSESESLTPDKTPDTDEKVESEVIESEKQPITDINVNEILTDVDKFQNRKDAFSQETYDSIIADVEAGKFNWGKFDAIKVWRDPNTNKLYTLNHTRLKAFQDLAKKGYKEFETIPAIEFKGTLEEAQKFAKEESNILGSRETDLERANIYRNDRQNGLSKKEILDKAKKLEKKNAGYVINLSYLNPEGLALQSLQAFSKSGSREDLKSIEAIADWIGDVRQKYPELKDNHEDEMFRWLKEGGYEKLKNKRNFNDRINNIVSNVSFDPSQALNLGQRVSKGYNQSNIESQISEIKNQIKELESERDNKKSPPTEVRLNKISEEIQLLNKDLGKLYQDLRAAREADQAQGDMFGSLEEAIEQGEISNDKSKEIIEGRNPEELEKSASDIERKAESESEAELNEAVKKADEIINEDQGEKPNKPKKPDDDLPPVKASREKFGVDDAFSKYGSEVKLQSEITSLDAERSDLAKLKDYKKHLELSIEQIEKKYDNDFEIKKIKKLDYSKTRAVNDLKDKYNLYGDKQGVQLIGAYQELHKTNKLIKDLQSKVESVATEGQTSMFGDPEIQKPEPPKKKVVETTKQQLGLFSGKENIIKRTYKDLKQKFNNQEVKTQNKISNELENSTIKYQPEKEFGVILPKRLVPNEWRKTHKINIAGNKLSADPQQQIVDIADMHYVIRDPKTETMFFVGIDESGTVVGHLAYSSNAANYVLVEQKSLKEIANELKDRGATRIVGLHNHPSGDPQPSDADIEAAIISKEIMKREGANLDEYVVINGDYFTHWKIPEIGVAQIPSIKAKETKVGYASGKTESYYSEILEEQYYNPVKHPNSKWYKEFDTFKDRVQLKDPVDIVKLTSQLKYGDGVVALVIVDAKLTIRGYEYFPSNILQDETAFKNYFEEQLKSHGGDQFFIVGTERDLRIDRESLEQNYNVPFFYDAKERPVLKSEYATDPYVATVAINDRKDAGIVVFQYSEAEKERLSTRPAVRMAAEKEKIGAEKKPSERDLLLRGIYGQTGGRSMGKQAYSPVVKSNFKDSDLNDPLRLKTIGKNLAANIEYDLGKDVRTGLVKRFMRRARGIYFGQSGIIRINNINDLTAFTHELGHKIDLEIFHTSDNIAFDGTKEAGEVVRAAGRKDAVMRQKLLDKLRQKYGNTFVDSTLEKYELRKELYDFLVDEGYPVGSYKSSAIVKEGIAEFVRNYVMNPSYIKKQAPKFHNLFDNLINQTPELKRALESAKEQYKNYSEQDPRIITESTIARNTDEDNWLEKIERTGEKFYLKVIDGVEPYRKLERELLKREPKLSGEDNPLLQVLTLLGGDGKAEQFLYYQPFKRTKNDVEFLKDVKPLFEILNPILKGGSLKQHEGYLVALRNIELHNNELGDAATTTIEVAQETVKLYESTYGKNELKKFRDDLYAYQNALLDYYYRSGKLSNEIYQQIKENNKYYIPFKRFFAEYESTGHVPNVAKLIKDSSPSPVKKIRGSSREVVSPIGSVIKNTFDLILSADRNNSLKVIIESLQKLDTRLVQEIPKTQVTGKLGVDGEVKWVFENKKPENEHIVSVWENGKVKYYQIPKDYYDSFFSLVTNYDKAIAVLSFPSRLLQAGAVQFDPTFAVRNIPRDQFSGTVFYSRYGYNPFWFLKGFASYAKKDEVYQKFLASGADQSFLTAVDQQLSKKYADKKAGKTIATRTREYTTNPLKLFQDVNRVSEIGTRVGAFRNALRKNNDVYKAMQEGRDIGADYGVKGLAMRNVSPLYPFLNARTQHMRQITSAWANNPGRTAIRGLLWVSAPTLLNWLLNNWDDEDSELYQELPEWRRILFFNIRIPFTKSFLPIPKDLVGQMFGTSVEYAMDYFWKKDRVTLIKVIEEAMQSYLPVSNEMELVPQFVRPLAEQFANKIAFTGRPIVPMKYEPLPSGLQYNDYTSHTIKVMAGDWLGLSPMRVEAFIRGYGAGFSSYPFAIADEFLEAAGVAEPNPDERFTLLGVNLRKMPLIKGFTPISPQGVHTSSVGDFYEKLDELENINRSINHFIANKNESAVLSYLSDEQRKKDYIWYLNNQTEVNKFKNAIAVARNLKIDILKDDEIKDKRNKADKLDAIIVGMAQRFNKAYQDNNEFDIDEAIEDILYAGSQKQKEKIETKEELKEMLDIDDSRGQRQPTNRSRGR